MRKSRVWIAVVVALGAGAALPAAQAQAGENVTVQFGAPGSGTPDQPIENSIAPAELRIQPGDRVTFNVDGFHQPVAYRLRFGESFEEAYARLDARAAQTDADGLARQRMAGQDTFVIGPAEPDRLTLLDVLSRYVFLGPTKPVPLLKTSVTSPPALPGRYVLLCNVRFHYQVGMRSTLVVG